MKRRSRTRRDKPFLRLLPWALVALTTVGILLRPAFVSEPTPPPLIGYIWVWFVCVVLVLSALRELIRFRVIAAAALAGLAVVGVYGSYKSRTDDQYYKYYVEARDLAQVAVRDNIAAVLGSVDQPDPYRAAEESGTLAPLTFAPVHRMDVSRQGGEFPPAWAHLGDLVISTEPPAYAAVGDIVVCYSPPRIGTDHRAVGFVDGRVEWLRVTRSIVAGWDADRAEYGLAPIPSMP